MSRKKPASILVAVIALLLISGCANLPKDFKRPQSYAYADTENTLLGRLFRDKREAHPDHSGFLLLGSGLDAFVARAVLAQGAERSIDVQYYLYHDDLVGRLFTYQLLKAADRGVRVRLLVDDMDLSGRDLGVAMLDSHPHIEVRIFNPFSRKRGRALQFVTRMGSVTRRMHNKSFTVDNQATILGGRNIGNEYFDADPDLVFADLDVLSIGPVVQNVSDAFDQYWNSEQVYPISVLRDQPLSPEDLEQKREQFEAYISRQADSDYLQALRNSDLAANIRQNDLRFYWGIAEIVYDQPEKIVHDFDQTEYHLGLQLKPHLEGIQKELIICSPYFVPGEEGTAFLKQLSKKGVRVRILTNSLASNDVGVVHAGYAKYRRDLLRGGAELYELNKKLTSEQRKEKKGTGGSSKSSLHAKSFVFDRRQVFIGSMNLDPRSLMHNTEIGVVFSSGEIAGEMGMWFDQNIEKIAFRLELQKDEDGYEHLLWHGLVDGQKQVFETEPYTSFWRRFGIGFLSLLPIESQL